MYHYSMTRTIGDDESHSSYFSVSDYDPVNSAHMLAAGFNTMTGNMMPGWALGVVNTEAGTVQYHGKVEQLKRDDPWSVSTTLHFTADPDGENMVTLFDNENGRLVFPGKLKFAETTTDEVLTKASADLAKSAAGHIARSVLEEAYAELQAVKEALYIAGAETITADVGVKDLSAALRARDDQIAELNKRDEHERRARQNMQEQYEQVNRSAVVEMVEYVKKAHVKLERIDPAGDREDLQGRMRGMLDVLAKFLVVMGEADHDERHAVARRLCEIGD